MIELKACMATQSWVNREYRRGLRTHPCGAPQQSGDVVSYLHHLWAAHREVQHPMTQGIELNDALGGYYGVEC